MILIKKDDELDIAIRKSHSYAFSTPHSGLHLIEIVAKANSWWQNLKSFKSFLNDDDLVVKIDETEFPKLSGRKGLFNGEAAWNGDNLKGNLKTGIFLVSLASGAHVINFFADQKPVLKGVRIYKIEQGEPYVPEKNNPPQDGDRRQWMTIALIDLSLKSLFISAVVGAHQRDDSDIKLIVDGKIIQNEQKNSHKNWFWCGNLSKGEPRELNKELNLPKGLHYVELWADKTPKLLELRINVDKDDSRIKAKIIWQTAALRREPNQKADTVAEISEGKQVIILEKAVLGKRPANVNGVLLSSDRWHKVEYENNVGYIYSEAVEIEGEDPKTIEKFILSKAEEVGADGCLMAAIAKRESHFFPYAVSGADAKGLFQMVKTSLTDVNDIFDKKIDNLFNIAQSTEAAILYFTIIRERYKNKNDFLRRCLAAWNWGKGNVDPGNSFLMKKLPGETRIFINEVLKNYNDCKSRSVLKGKINLLFLLMSGFFISAILLSFAIFFAFDDKNYKEPPSYYGDNFVLAEHEIDVDGDGTKEKLVVIRDKLNSTFGMTRNILVRSNGRLRELSKEEGNFLWWKVGDFNDNGKVDIAIHYGYTGSGEFGKFYLQEWNGKDFTTVFIREDVDNKVNFVDLNHDGMEEIIYTYRLSKWKPDRYDIYQWNAFSSKLILYK
ncbi:hypothetical protein EPN28_04000 [Patescibacteria group bacterium]|nr:MAG: hypothetical protein EPN28_04000 [Patescibacteria group bacterium]